MFCPECREYRESIGKCDDCGVDLVAEAPVEHDLDLEPVLRTTNQTLVTAFQTALTAAGIPHIVRGAEAAHLMPFNATVAVPQEHLEAARELLREAEADHIVPEPDSET